MMMIIPVELPGGKWSDQVWCDILKNLANLPMHLLPLLQVSEVIWVPGRQIVKKILVFPAQHAYSRPSSMRMKTFLTFPPVLFHHWFPG